MELDAERGAPRANITTFGDAVWWSVSTMATVGYGDRCPVTVAGRAIGIVLMIAGVGLFGIVAAVAAAWFIADGTEQQERQQAKAVSSLTSEVTSLRHEIRQLRRQLAAQPHHPQPLLQASYRGTACSLRSPLPGTRRPPSPRQHKTECDDTSRP
jgi:hypothetical protein